VSREQSILACITPDHRDCASVAIKDIPRMVLECADLKQIAEPTALDVAERFPDIAKKRREG
jgi:hypothetical protein